MRLENLYPNFAKQSVEEQAAYIASYRLKRAQDLVIEPKQKKSRSGKGSKIDLSDEEKALMKLLGLKQKDVLALRAVDVDTEEQEDNGAELFKDTTFEEGDE